MNTTRLNELRKCGETNSIVLELTEEINRSWEELDNLWEWIYDFWGDNICPDDIDRMFKEFVNNKSSLLKGLYMRDRGAGY